VLALLGLEAWVTVTTSFVAALATYNSVSPAEERLRRARAASRTLNNLIVQWDSVATEKRGQQPVIDQLVQRAEAAILDAVEPPPVSDTVRSEEPLA
jgi:hypothetical protein